MLRGTRSTHQQLPAINNRAQWALLIKGEVLLPAVTFLVAFEEGAAGKWEGGRKGITAAGQLQINHSEWAEDVRERQRSQPLRLWHRLQEAHLHQHPAQGRERDNRDKEYLQHTALIKERGQTKTCVRVILPQLMAVCVHTEKCLQMGGKTLDGENCYNAQPLVAYCSKTQYYIYSGFSQCTLFQATSCKKIIRK